MPGYKNYTEVNSFRMLDHPAPHSVLDTNVLLGQVTRGLFLHLARRKLAYPHWSNVILTELRSCRSADENIATALRELESYPAGLVESLLPLAIRLPDPQDEHVLALAHTVQASSIVTFNKRDFPSKLCEGITVVTPDEYFCDLYRRAPGTLMQVLKEQCGELDWQAYVAKLNRARLHKLSRALRATAR